MSHKAHQHSRAEHIRDACINAAIEAYEDAGIRGLCHEGRWALALDAMKHINLSHLAPENTKRKEKP